jgi:hypothetical protein
MNSLIMLAASACYVSSSAARMDDEDDDEGDDGDVSDQGPSEPLAAKPQKKKASKKVKKVAKKAAKKVDKAPAKKADASDKNRVRLKDLAKQAKLTEAVARKRLRDADVPRGEGRWSWELGSKALKAARKALDLAA